MKVMEPLGGFMWSRNTPPGASYKRASAGLVSWAIKTAKEIPGGAATVAGLSTNTVTVTQIESIFNIIAKHGSIALPLEIHDDFLKVIGQRTILNAYHSLLFTQNPSPELDKKNKSHSHFIKVLKKAFDGLGGPSLSESNGRPDPTLIQTNPFAVLRPPTSNQGEESSSDESNHESGPKGKAVEKVRQTPTPAQSALLDDTPAPKYCMFDDEDGTRMIDYIFETRELFRLCALLQSDLKTSWYRVMHGKMSSAVAGAALMVAVKAIKLAEDKMPMAHESDNLSCKTMFEAYKYGDREDTKEGDLRTSMIATYDALVGFVTDFHKRRDGRPSKEMQQQVKDWDPEFDLEGASEEEEVR